MIVLPGDPAAAQYGGGFRAKRAFSPPYSFTFHDTAQTDTAQTRMDSPAPASSVFPYQRVAFGLSLYGSIWQ